MGKLVVVSAPSGGGKNTVVNYLIKKLPNSARFVTTTTRPSRGQEKHGVDYFFISKEEFEKKIKYNEFVEYNFFDNNYYGTEKEKMREFLDKYDYVFFVIDVNGKNNLDRLGIKHYSIFLLPESFENLKQRIMNRGGLSEDSVIERLKTAEKEIKQADEYDLSLVNKEGKLEDTVLEILCTLKNKHILTDK